MYEGESAERYQYEIRHRGGVSQTIATSRAEIVELIEKSECGKCSQIMDVKVDRDDTSVAILRCPKCKDQYIFPADVLWL